MNVRFCLDLPRVTCYVDVPYNVMATDRWQVQDRNDESSNNIMGINKHKNATFFSTKQPKNTR